MALMVARAVPEKTGPTSSTMAVPHGPAGVGAARRRMRRELGERAVPEQVVDDAVLILSELLSNSCRYARPLGKFSELVGRTTADMVDAVLVRAVTASRHGGAETAEENDPGGILVRWWTHADGIVVEVTDGGAPTRPRPSQPVADGARRTRAEHRRQAGRRLGRPRRAGRGDGLGRPAAAAGAARRSGRLG
ncbi:ATP-binding protein [Kitasatospora arboriphila]